MRKVLTLLTLMLTLCAAAGPLLAQGAGKAADPSLFAPKDTNVYVRIESINALLGGWNQYAMQLGPMAAMVPVQQKFGQILNNPTLAGLDRDRPMGLAIRVRPALVEGGQPEVRSFMFLPVGNKDDLTDAMADAPGAIKILPVGDYAVYVEDEADLELAQAAGKAIKTRPGVVSMHLDAQSLKPMIVKALKDTRRKMTDAARMNPQAAGNVQMVESMFQAFEENIDEVKGIDLTGSIDKDNLSLDLSVTAMDNTELAKTLTMKQALETGLLKHLPKNSFAVGFAQTSPAWHDLLVKMSTMQYEAIAKDDQQKKLVEQYGTMLDDLLGEKPVSVAFAMTNTGPGMGVELVEVLKAGKDYRDKMLAYFEQTKALQEFAANKLQAQGMKMSQELKKDVAKVDGHPVDEFHVGFQIVAGGGMPPQMMMANQVLQAVFGGGTFVMATTYVDDKVVVATGRDRMQLLEQTVKALKADDEAGLLPTTPLHKKSMAFVPKGSFAFGYMNPTGLAKWATGIAAQMGGGPVHDIVQKMPPGQSSFSGALGMDDGRISATLNLPSGAVNEIMTIVMQVRMQMQQQGPRQGPPPQF